MTNDALKNFDFDRLSGFYASEYNLLISTGLYRGFDLEQVKDVIHQLFLDFVEKKINLESINNPSSYILTSFKRRLIDIHRSNVRHASADHSSLYDFAQQSVDKVIEQNETSAQLASRIFRAYELLPERCKKVIFLKYYEGLTNDEIRQRTGLSIRSIYNNLSEGIRQLRSALSSPTTSTFGKIASIGLLLLSTLP